jgi:hypothetical protein
MFVGARFRQIQAALAAKDSNQRLAELEKALRDSEVKE